MGRTTFSGPVRTGQDTGVPATTTLGTLLAHQYATVVSNTSGGSSIVLPANAKIVDMILEVLVSASGNATGVTTRVGTGTDPTQLASITATAKGTYRPGVTKNFAAASAAVWDNVGTSALRVWIDVTATSVTNQFSARLGVIYAQR